MEQILFLTGHLAEPALRRLLDRLEARSCSYKVLNIGISVAALMTVEMVCRRVTDAGDADRIVVPGHCRGDLELLAAQLGVAVERGPVDLKDLPEFLGHGGRPPVDLSRHDLQIFAEITDAPQLDLSDILLRARYLRTEGADVIDLGCLPETPFPHLEEAVQALHAEGLRVSVDSLEQDELLRGGRAGADYLLSLTEDSLWIADEVAATPVLIPTREGGLESLSRSIRALESNGRPHLADPILAPLHFGFTESLCRYRELRRWHPDTEILMGAGNVTELTEADTVGMSALLTGICSELHIRYMLTTQVSPHARTVVRETDRARRIMFAARENSDLPKGYGGDLLALHERRPFTESREEISELAARVRDPNFRIQVSDAGIHIYNRAGMHTHHDPLELFPYLCVDEDGAHAFYLGMELGRAQIALQLGKRYVQDEELRWGCLVDAPSDNKSVHRKPGPTMKARKDRNLHRKGRAARTKS